MVICGSLSFFLWFLMVSCGSWWFLVFLGGDCHCVMVIGGSWWFLVSGGCWIFCWLFVIFDDFWWFLVIIGVFFFLFSFLFLGVLCGSGTFCWF